MKSPAKSQMKFRVVPEFARRVKAYCAARQITENALCQAALEQYLAGVSMEEVVLRRLDRNTMELNRLHLAVELLGESLGAFVKLWLGHNPEIENRERASAQREVARRYRVFVEYVKRGVRDGHGTLLHRLIEPGLSIADADELDAIRLQGDAELGADAGDEAREGAL